MRNLHRKDETSTLNRGRENSISPYRPDIRTDLYKEVNYNLTSVRYILYSILVHVKYISCIIRDIPKMSAVSMESDPGKDKMELGDESVDLLDSEQMTAKVVQLQSQLDQLRLVNILIKKTEMENLYKGLSTFSVKDTSQGLRKPN